MKMRFLGIVFLLLVQVAFARAAEVQVFAAASLSDALKEIGATFSAASGDKIIFNFGASSTLARQIEEGAPADIFFSADDAKMDALAARNLIVKNTRVELLANRLAVVAAKDIALTIKTPADLAAPAVKKLALGEPATVPAGIYAREWLTKLGLWETLQPRVIPCDNVRAALAAVEAGNADAGIVYQTDAAISKKVRVVFVVAGESAPRITYPVALVAASKQTAASADFLTYLAGDEAAAVFARFGFLRAH